MLISRAHNEKGGEGEEHVASLFVKLAESPCALKIECWQWWKHVVLLLR